MTVIVSQPSHIGLPTPPLDIPYGPDPSTPRAVLAHTAIDVVAAAVALAPSLSPSLPSDNPEYCLSSKRKAADDDDDSDLSRPTKRAKPDDEALFGPLTTPSVDTVPSALPTNADSMQAAIEQALAAILSYSPSQSVSSQPSESPASLPAQNHAATTRTTHSPLAVSIDSSNFDNSLQVPTPLLNRSRLPSPPRNRVVELPLWKLACRTRVDHVIALHGSQAVRATLVQEQVSVQTRTPRSPSNSRGSQARRSSLESSSEQLELEIYTPLTFPQPSLSSNKDVLPALAADVDVEMSYDLDSDSDSDTDSDTGDDDDFDALGANESILDVSLSGSQTESCLTPTPADSTMAFASLMAPMSIPPPIVLPTLPPIWPPRLPRLSTIPVYCLREYPQMELLGTPSSNAVDARGSFPHKTSCPPTPVRSSDCMSLVL